MRNQRLVKVINQACATFNGYVHEARNLFDSFKGRKILKADGSFTAAFMKAMEPLREKFRLDPCHVYFEKSSYSIWLKVRATDSQDGPFIDSEKTYGVGEIEGQICKGATENGVTELKSDWTVEEIEGKLAEIERLEKVVRELKTEVPPEFRR